MFDETINRQQLLDDLSIQVGRIKARSVSYNDAFGSKFKFSAPDAC